MISLKNLFSFQYFVCKISAKWWTLESPKPTTQETEQKPSTEAPSSTIDLFNWDSTRFPSESTTVAPILSTMRNFPTTPISQPSSKRDRLFVGDKLFVNETLVSDNDEFEARLLKDGTVVVSDHDDDYFRLKVDPRINLNVDETEEETLFLQMLPDGQLVLSISDRRGVIKSQVPLETNSKQDCSSGFCVLIMQGDGNLVAYYNKYESNDPPFPFFSAWHCKYNHIVKWMQNI